MLQGIWMVCDASSQLCCSRFMCSLTEKQLSRPLCVLPLECSNTFYLPSIQHKEWQNRSPEMYLTVLPCLPHFSINFFFVVVVAFVFAICFCLGFLQRFVLCSFWPHQNNIRCRSKIIYYWPKSCQVLTNMYSGPKSEDLLYQNSCVKLW